VAVLAALVTGLAGGGVVGVLGVLAGGVAAAGVLAGAGVLAVGVPDGGVLGESAVLVGAAAPCAVEVPCGVAVAAGAVAVAAEVAAELTPAAALVTVEVAADVAEVAADVAEDVVDVTAEVSVLVTGDPAWPGEVAVGAVAACACRENTSKTTRIPAASIAHCAARRAAWRNASCGIGSSPPRETGPDTTAHL
jgi:hypothetical protein